MYRYNRRSVLLVRYISIVLAASLFLLLCPGFSVADATSSEKIISPATIAARASQERVPGEVIVRLREGTGSDGAAAVFGRHGFPQSSYHRIVERIPLYLARFPESSRDIKSVLRDLLSDDEVISAEPNYIIKCDSKPTHADSMPSNDPDLRQQWALWSREVGEENYGAPGSIDATGAWGRGAGTSNVVVAVLDTGADTTHPDLNQALVAGWNCIEENENVTDGYGHGTHVAGIIAATANNGIGIAGTVGPNTNVKIMPVRIFDNEGKTTLEDELQGIYWAADHGANIINMSFSSPVYSDPEEYAVNDAYERGCVLIGATGNSGGNVEYPARLENVIAVGASDQMASFCVFSCRGEGLDLVAPGTSILSTIPGGDYDRWDGTSMAAPHVSGVAALLLANRPDFSPALVESCLNSTAYKPPDYYNQNDYGAGILDAYEALDRAVAPDIIIASQWYFPEGSTNGFEEWLCIQNAESATATVGIEYMTLSGSSFYDSFTMAPQTRQTVAVHDQMLQTDVSARVFSDRQIYAERSMYWAGRREGHDCHGLKTPAKTWCLAEGCVGRSSGFHTFVLIQNPNDVEAHVNSTFQTNSEKIPGPSFVMPKRSRHTIHLNDYLPTDTDASTIVTGDQGLLAERSMY